MSCTPQENRPVQTVDFLDIDFRLLAEAIRYANGHSVSLQTLVESALVTFILDQMEPLPLRVCATHGVVMEGNSSGTTMACPVNEGATAVFYLGGETT